MVYEYRVGGVFMRLWWRRSVSVLAIYVIALTTILSAFSAPRPAGAAFDPFSVICHSGPAAGSATGQVPDNQTPTKACEHCSLCFAAASLAGPEAIPAGRLTPPYVLQVLTPASIATRAHFAGTPNVARGPPQQA